MLIWKVLRSNIQSRLVRVRVCVTGLKGFMRTVEDLQSKAKWSLPVYARSLIPDRVEAKLLLTIHNLLEILTDCIHTLCEVFWCSKCQVIPIPTRSTHQAALCASQSST